MLLGMNIVANPHWHEWKLHVISLRISVGILGILLLGMKKLSVKSLKVPVKFIMSMKSHGVSV